MLAVGQVTQFQLGAVDGAIGEREAEDQVAGLAGSNLPGGVPVGLRRRAVAHEPVLATIAVDQACLEIMAEQHLLVGVVRDPERAASMPEYVQDSLGDVLAERGRLTGDDVREANQVTVEEAVGELEDLFADMPDLKSEPESDWERTTRQIAGELGVILRTYKGSIDLAEWRVIADHAWLEVFGQEEKDAA